MFSITKRAAFQSLLAKLRDSGMRSSLKRISCPLEARRSREKRRASAPYFSIISTGSTPLPSDLDMRRPFLSSTVAKM